MNEFEYIWNEVQNPSVMKQFESDLSKCFLSESARITGRNLSFYATHDYLIYEDDEHVPEDERGTISIFLDKDTIESQLYENGWVTYRLSYNASEDEYNQSRLKELFEYSDIEVMRNMREKFKRYVE